MSHPIAIEVNCETGDVTERPLTADEVLQREADADAAATAEAERVAAEEAKASARASAITKLAALGLTADEAAAIVGPNPQS